MTALPCPLILQRKDMDGNNEQGDNEQGNAQANTPKKQEMTHQAQESQESQESQDNLKTQETQLPPSRASTPRRDDGSNTDDR